MFTVWPLIVCNSIGPFLSSVHAFVELLYRTAGTVLLQNEDATKMYFSL